MFIFSTIVGEWELIGGISTPLCYPYISICTVGKIYTPIFSFFRKRFVNIAILEVGPVSNERPGILTFYLDMYRDIHEFLSPTIFLKVTVFSILGCNCHFTEVKWQI